MKPPRDSNIAARPIRMGIMSMSTTAARVSRLLPLFSKLSFIVAPPWSTGPPSCSLVLGSGGSDRGPHLPRCAPFYEPTLGV